MVGKLFQGIHTQRRTDEIAKGADVPDILQIINLQLAAFFVDRNVSACIQPQDSRGMNSKGMGHTPVPA